MSFFKSRRMALGKSFKLGFLLRIADATVCSVLDLAIDGSILPLICFLRWAACRPFLGNRRGKANMENEASKIVEATKIIPIVQIKDES
jgi:hypothetical protein